MIDQRQHHPTSRNAVKYWFFLFTIVAAAIVVDQVSKAYVVAHLALHESWMPLDFVEPVFRFTHVHNTGAAFGMFPGGGMVFLVIALVVTAVILYYYRQIEGPAWLIRLALGLQLGGAISNNLIDRVRLGYVVDFFNVVYWPVFNVADSCIVVGVALLAFELLRDEWRAARDDSQQREAASSNNAEPHGPESSEEQAYS